MGVWESTDHCVLWGMSAQQDCTGPFPLEGRMELLLSWLQYSSFLQACCVPWHPSVYLGKGWGAEWVCGGSQGLLPDLTNMSRSLLTPSCLPPPVTTPSCGSRRSSARGSWPRSTGIEPRRGEME